MKSIVTMISSFQVDYFAEWLLYFVVIGIVVLNVSLEFFRQRALAYFGALFVVPIYQVLLIVGSAMMGAVFFNEFAGLRAYELVLFIIAIMITMTRVGVMAFNLGKRLEKVKDFIKVALLRADQMFEHHDGPAFPVWSGFLSQLLQNYYIQRTTFYFNATFEVVKEVGQELRDDVKDGIHDAVEIIQGDDEEKDEEQEDETEKITEP